MNITKTKLFRSIPEPAVSRKALIIGAGIFWILGAVVLLYRAIGLVEVWSVFTLMLIMAGIVLGLLKGYFVLSKVARKNIERIYELSPYKDKICLFAFQSIESYLLVIVMMAVGILIRQLPINMTYIVAIYFAISSALFISSFSYFRNSNR